MHVCMSILRWVSEQLGSGLGALLVPDPHFSPSLYEQNHMTERKGGIGLFVNSDKDVFLSWLLLVVISCVDLGDFTYPFYIDL